MNDAIAQDNLAKLRKLLDEGVDINQPDVNGRTALHMAMDWNRPHMAMILLERGADVSVRNNMNQTPLHLASARGMIHIIKMLMQKGADAAARDKDGKTPIDYARKPSIRTLLENAQPRTVAREVGRALSQRLPHVIRGLKADEQQLPYGQVRVKEGKYDTGLPPGIPERIGQFVAHAPVKRAALPPDTRGGRKTRRRRKQSRRRNRNDK